MPQALAAVLFNLGISAIAATVISTVVFAVATSFISGLLIGKPSSKSDRTERAIKNPTPARNKAFGSRRPHGTWAAL